MTPPQSATRGRTTQKGPGCIWRSGPRIERIPHLRKADDVWCPQCGRNRKAASRYPRARRAASRLYPRALRRTATAAARAQAARAAVARGTATGISSPVWARRAPDLTVDFTGVFAAGSATV